MLPISNTRKLSGLIIVSLFLANIFVFASAVSAAEGVRIMPLGDSITKGDDNGGYRQKLFLDLTGAGFDVDFVGNESHPVSPDPPFDTDHEGHSGWHADHIRDNVYDWLVLNPADIVLLHIGTNDITWGGQRVVEVWDVLEEIDRFENDFSVNVTVILARIILRTDNVTLREWTEAFNVEVVAMAEYRIADGDDIVIVDMENALTYPDDLLADGKHPNPTGYEKMADVWYAAIFALVKVDTVLDFMCTPNPASPGQTVELIGDLTEGGGNPIYPASVIIEYSTDGGTTWKYGLTLTTNSTGDFSLTFSAPGVGEYVLRASFEGSDNYNPSSHIETLTVQLLLLDTKVTFNLSPNPVTVGQSITLQGTLTDVGDDPIVGATLRLYLKVGAGPWQLKGSLSTNSTGGFKASGTVASTGTYDIAVYYGGSGIYRSSYSIETLTVNP